MDLSIVITTKDRIEYLRDCVASILKAKLDHVLWELIVVDDRSTDGTEKLEITEWEGVKGKVFHNPEPQMMVKSRNIGARAASGELIMFIDDDNIVAEDMFAVLLKFVGANTEYGIIGPSMYYADSGKKYLDFQRINLITGKTTGVIDNGDGGVCESDGIPNAFLIQRGVFEKCGYFDEALIQTFTEPDFAFNARNHGYQCGIVKAAKIFHSVSKDDNYSPRALGGKFSQKAYCLMRNRTVFVSRYGNRTQVWAYLLFFSWVWPLIYSVLMLRSLRVDLIKLYWWGWIDGVRYLLTGRLHNSLPVLLKN